MYTDNGGTFLIQALRLLATAIGWCIEHRRKLVQQASRFGRYVRRQVQGARVQIRRRGRLWCKKAASAFRGLSDRFERWGRVL